MNEGSLIITSSNYKIIINLQIILCLKPLTRKKKFMANYLIYRIKRFKNMLNYHKPCWYVTLLTVM